MTTIALGSLLVPSYYTVDLHLNIRSKVEVREAMRHATLNIESKQSRTTCTKNSIHLPIGTLLGSLAYPPARM